MTPVNYEALVESIIRAQEAIIGPLARDVARRVGIDAPDKATIEALVKKYEEIFGRASVETCKDAIAGLVAQNKDIDLPMILK